VKKTTVKLFVMPDWAGGRRNTTFFFSENRRKKTLKMWKEGRLAGTNYWEKNCLAANRFLL
jgi:hypothetical protein